MADVSNPGGLAEMPSSVAAWLRSPKDLLIDNSAVAAVSGKRMEVINPSTGAPIALVAEAGAHDVDIAVSAARRAFDTRSWRGMQVDDRAKILWRLADLLESHADELGYLQTLENGMPLAFSTGSCFFVAGWLRHFAGGIKRIGGRTYAESISAPGEWHSYTRKEPVGVVGMITPWNGPLGTLIIKAAPALAAGCSIVAKPSELTPLACLRFGELALEAGLPPGVLNILPGFGADAGAALVAHRDVNKVSFTGSTPVGKAIVRAAADNLKRVTLELGGKSPCFVFDDADMDLAIPGAAMAIFFNTGQNCIAGSRLFIQRKSFDTVVAGIAAFAEKLKVGNGLAPGVDLGPLISRKQRERVIGYIESGVAEGGELVTGGKTVGDEGFFIAPTVFVNTRADMTMVREEIFGPVVSAVPFDTLSEVPALANAIDFGLASGIFTTNVNTVHRLAAQIDAGNVYVNCYAAFDANMPFGGFKQSGWGRELGNEGLEAYLETKSVHLSLT